MQVEMGMRNFAQLAVALLLFFAGFGVSYAQNPIPAANSKTEHQDEGFYPGWSLGVRFEGSTNSDGSVYDLGTGVGYNFSHHFGVDLGVPYYFVGTPSSVKKKNPGAVSGNGIGNFGADLKWLFPSKTMNYASTVHLGAPTGDTKKGFSNGHATWNWTNHVEHGLGNFTPFIDAGAGNTVADTRYFHRPYMTFGYNAQFEAGTEMDAGPLSLSASAYDVAPWGNQSLVQPGVSLQSQRQMRCGGKEHRSQRVSFEQCHEQWRELGCAIMASTPAWNSSQPRPSISEVDYSHQRPLAAQHVLVRDKPGRGRGAAAWLPDQVDQGRIYGNPRGERPSNLSVVACGNGYSLTRCLVINNKLARQQLRE